MDNPADQNQTPAALENKLEMPEAQNKVIKKPLIEKRVLLTIILSVIAVSAAAVGGNYVMQLRDTVRVDDSDTTTFTVIDDTKINNWNIYKTDVLNFSVSFPKEAELKEPTTMEANPLLYKIEFMGENQIKPNPEDNDLNDGYLLKIYAHVNSENRSISDLAAKKRTNYQSKCPGLASVLEIETTIIANRAAQVFEVLDCNVNYKETFIYDRETVFEFVQVYRGDLGFKQAYKSKVQEIQDTFEFINIPPEQVEWVSVVITSSKLTFQHPSFNSKCCNIQEPPGGVARKALVLADVEEGVKVKDSSTKFDGIGFYTIDNKERKSLADLVTNQRNLLISDYRVVVGRSPSTPIEQNLKIDGLDAVLLKGYTWWAEEILYISSPKNETFFVVIKTEKTPGSFKETFQKIIESIAFL